MRSLCLLGALVALGAVVDACGDGADTGAALDSSPAARDTVATLDAAAPAADVERPCREDQCDIGGECVDNGAPHPFEPCLACLVIASRQAWSPDDAATCDDGDPCTEGDACVDGACAATPLSCDDADPCTRDRCDAGECVHEAAPQGCGVDPCAAAPPPGCDDGNPCTDDACEPWEGCVHTPAARPCDDESACTTADRCVDGECVGTELIDCDDDNVCTIDVCTADAGCQYSWISHLCADDNPCTDEACDPRLGCVYPFNSDSCDDGDACTLGDTCVEGACVGAPLDPDDGNICTDDACDPLSGVVHGYNTQPCQDGNACTVGDVCSGGLCRAGAGAPECDDGNECTSDGCDPATGCFHDFNTSGCDDHDACTEGDVCRLGVCGGRPVDCDDGNACTDDTCDSVAGCRSSLIVSNSCRPTITVDYPRRGATIEGAAATQVVDIRGRVVSGAGPITSFTINGAPVDVASDGSFNHSYAAEVGGNILVFEATDSFGTSRRRVQSFLWSTSYRKPTTPKSGIVSEGIGVWLDENVIDDGDRSLPPNDLATIFELVLGGLDVASFIPNPAAEDADAGSLVGTYDVFLSDFTYDAPTVSLAPRSGGLRLAATIANAKVDVRADKTCSAGLASCWGPGSVTGEVAFGAIGIDVDVDLSVSNHDIVVAIPSSEVSISGYSIDVDGALGWLIEWVLETFVLPDLIGDIEEQFNGAIAPQLGPLLRDALRELAFATSVELPSLAGGDPVVVDLITDFQAVPFDADGGKLVLRAGAWTDPQRTPYDNRGVPGRVGCNSGDQTLVVPEARDLELVLADDLLNQILYAVWRGGLLEFPVPDEWLEGQDLSQYGVTDLSLAVSGLLAPTASDCGGGGGLEAHIGDLKVTADLKLFGVPVDVVVWVSLVAGVELAADDGEISVAIGSVDQVETEVVIAQEPLIAAEEQLRSLIEDQLLDSLIGALGGEALGSIPLPNIDLSDALPTLPPGTGIAINPQVLYRMGGNTIVGGALD